MCSDCRYYFWDERSSVEEVAVNIALRCPRHRPAPRPRPHRHNITASPQPTTIRNPPTSDSTSQHYIVKGSPGNRDGMTPKLETTSAKCFIILRNEINRCVSSRALNKVSRRFHNPRGGPTTLRSIGG